MAKIMVLDDEEDICQLVERVLVECGHEVTTFTGAAESMKWLRSNKPDLALLDFKLRGMDGLSVLEYIRQNFPEIKAIMITGKPSPEVKVKAIELGLEDYLVKPLEISILEYHVNKVLGLLQDSKIDTE